MNPPVDAVLRDIAQQISEEICPSIDGYHRGTLSMAAVMLSMAADEWDVAASNRVAENRAIRALLKEGAPMVSDDMAARHCELASRSDDDLRISALDRANAPLRAALIELQVVLETQPGYDAGALLEKIWSELKVSTERRGVSAAPF